MELKTIYVTDLWNTDALTEDGSMFYKAYDLTGEKGTSYSTYSYNAYYLDLYSNYEPFGKEFAHIDGGASNPGYLTYKGHNKDFSLLQDHLGSINSTIRDAGTSVVNFREATEEEYNEVKDSLTDSNLISLDYSPYPTYMWIDGENVLYYSEASIIYTNASLYDGIYYTDLVNIDLSGWDTSLLATTQDLFPLSPRLEQVDLSGWDTSRLVEVSNMFGKCPSLTTVYVSDSWDLSNTTNSTNMFSESVSIVDSKAGLIKNQVEIDILHMKELLI